MQESRQLFAQYLGFVLKIFAEGEALDDHAEDVLESKVRLLNVHGYSRRDDDVVIAEVTHLAAVVAGEADGGDADFFGLMKRFYDVGGIAGGGDAEEDIAGLAESFDLALEEVVVAEVVAGGGEDGGVGGEGDGAEGGPIDGEADDEFGDEVLSVGGGASIACNEQLLARLHGLCGKFADADEGIGDVLVGEDGLHGGDGLGQLLLNEFLHGPPWCCLMCDFIAGNAAAR
jgi:hypothetical protein